MTTPAETGANDRTSADGGVPDGHTRTRSSTAGSSTGRGRTNSLSARFLESSPPVGMWQATGTALAAMPSPMEIRRGEYGSEGWDAPIQRRNSLISNDGSGRLSRVSSARSTAQTPASLGRTNTFLGTHAEESEETAKFSSRPQPSGQQSKTEPASSGKQPAASNATGDDDDPFSKFIGRGKIDSQSYTPRPKTQERAVDPLENDLDDDRDSIDDLDPNRPIRRNKGPSKKFRELTGDGVPKPDTKIVTTSTRPASSSQTSKEVTPAGPDESGLYPTGYRFPPKHTWGEATMIGLKGFWKFTITPLGFLIVIYGLNVVAWGGMLFLLLIGGGSQFMCYPKGGPPGYKNCNAINSPRRIWIEIDSQILNSLFCVTGFGLIPWRFRDLYYLMQYRLRHKHSALQKLAGIHRSWFRLPGSQDIPADRPATGLSDCDTNPALPFPVSKAPDPPLTGFRAPPTAWWKLDYVIWAYVFNTFLQAVLSGFMWGFNRYTRPSWSTGTFVALACIVAALGGLMCFLEGKRIKAVEGIPVSEADALKAIEEDVEQGIAAGEKEHGKGKERDEKTVR